MKVIKSESFLKWYNRCRDKKTRVIILDHITRMMDGMVGDVRDVGDGVWEKKIHYGPGYRLYYTLISGRVILLLGGGDKSTQSRDIAKAKRVRKEYHESRKI